MDRWLLAVATAFHAANFALVFTQLVRGRVRATMLGLLLAAAGFMAQCLFLWGRGEWQGRCPITNACEVLAFLAWASVLWYFLLGPSYRLSLLGIFNSGLVALLQLVAMLPGVYSDAKSVPRHPVNPWLELHGSLSLLAYGAFAIAALAGILFIFHDRQLKKRPPPPVFLHLPPITHLFRAMMLVLSLGCVLLVAGMISGYFTDFRPSGMKHAVSYIVLATYAGVVAMRWCGISHRRVAMGAAAGFVVAILSLWVVS